MLGIDFVEDPLIDMKIMRFLKLVHPFHGNNFTFLVP